MINRIKRNKKFFGFLSLALAVSIIICAIPILASEAEQDTAKPDTVQVVVLTRDVARGVMITDACLTTVTVKNENLPTNIITDITKVTSKYAKVPLYEGEYVFAEQLSSKKINRLNQDILAQEIAECTQDYLIVTDYVLPDTGKDVVGALQDLIDENPGRTIYFPKGEYIISTPLCTPAMASKSVSIQLADGAVIKAANTWKPIKDSYEQSTEDGGTQTVTRTINSLIALGASSPENNIVSAGSYYSLKGGTLDGNGKADGVSIQSGRESLIRNIFIKNFDTYGIYIAKGANGNSSDCDFEDITIVGNGKMNTTGIHFVGYDNSVTNVRIYNCEIGINSSVGQGNLFKNIYFYNDPEVCRNYLNTVAFRDGGTSNNWLSDCYVENYAIAFDLGTRSILRDSVAVWNSELCTRQIFARISATSLALGGCRAEFFGDAAETAFISTSSNWGTDIIEGCMFNDALCDDKSYRENLATPIIPLA